MELFGEVWRRATSVQPAPPPGLIALTALAAFALVALPSIWPYTRVMITITHEGGHAFAALLTGRKLQGIRLHTDTSGLTISSGRPRGPGMVIMLLAGYLAPALVGLAAVGLLLAGHSLALLWLLVIILGLMLIKIRNIYGVVVIIGCAAGLLAISWYASAAAQSGLAYLITWILLLASPKPVLELIGQRRRHRTPQSDADQLSRLSKVPAGLWLTGFLVINSVGLLVGAALLLPALADLAVDLVARLTAA